MYFMNKCNVTGLNINKGLSFFSDIAHTVTQFTDTACEMDRIKQVFNRTQLILMNLGPQL